VFRIKYDDADGRQVMETLGPERDGWTRRKAEAELRERLVKVERRGWRKPAPLSFAAYADEWVKAGPVKRGWKPSTPASYRSVLRRLKDAFGPMPLAAVRPRDVAAYVTKQLETYAGKTVNKDLSVLHDIYRTAIGEEVAEANPVDGVQRPKVVRRKWKILTPAEATRVAQAFANGQAQLIFLTLMLTGIRRDELRGLRWRDVDLVGSVLKVVESKSEEGERSIALPPLLAEALWQHRRASAFKGEDELVFAHPERGTRIDHEWYAGRVPEGAQGGEGHRVRPPVPRPPPREPHKRRRRRRAAARANDPRRPPQHGNDTPVPPPRRCHLPRESSGARAAPPRR
jgi:integrase